MAQSSRLNPTMKIRMLQTRMGWDGNCVNRYEEGRIYEVGTALAVFFVGKKYAEYVEE